MLSGQALRLDVDVSQPLAYGMNEHSAAFFAFSSAFEPAPRDGSAAPVAVQTIARYGASDVLVSGWLEGENVIANRAAVAQVTVGQGRVVLIGFPAQHRAQSHATYRLLFNALLTAQRPKAK